MKILLDECLPRQLRHDLPDHDVTTVATMGWVGTKNGALLRLAASDFDVFITIDRNIAYQQRLQIPNMAVILLVAPNNRRETLRLLIADIRTTLKTIRAGDVARVSI